MTTDVKQERGLSLRPITLRAANAFVREHHRHHKDVRGHVFSLSCVDASNVVHGVAIAGRPVARMLQDGVTAEVTRLCTDGTPNACSFLCGAARRAAKALGYTRLITYTLATEPGVSLRAAGWVCEGIVRGGTWSRPSRQRIDKHPLGDKLRWRAAA